MENTKPNKNDRREIFGWMLYDWANSAFYTTVVAVLLGPYLIALAEKSVGKNGLILNLYLFDVTTGGLPAFCIAISVISMVPLDGFLSMGDVSWCCILDRADCRKMKARMTGFENDKTANWLAEKLAIKGTRVPRSVNTRRAFSR